MDTRKNTDNSSTENVDNKNKQDVDKAPGEERGKGEQVQPENLKGKKVDADPTLESDKPADSSKQ